jgi:hypothetical protein
VVVLLGCANHKAAVNPEQGRERSLGGGWQVDQHWHLKRTFWTGDEALAHGNVKEREVSRNFGDCETTGGRG